MPAVALIAIALVGSASRRGVPIARIGCELAFLGYVVGVISVTLFPIILEPGFIDQMRQANRLVDGINVVPLGGLGAADGILVRQVLLNVLLGVPFGFGLPFLGVVSTPRVIGLGLASAASIELLQLAIDVAYQFGYRTVDVNDVIANVVGVVAGIGLFRLVRLGYGALNMDAKDVGDYLNTVLSAP